MVVEEEMGEVVDKAEVMVVAVAAVASEGVLVVAVLVVVVLAVAGLDEEVVTELVWEVDMVVVVVSTALAVAREVVDSVLECLSTQPMKEM